MKNFVPFHYAQRLPDGALAEAYPDGRTDLAQSFDQSEASIRGGLRAMHQRPTSAAHTAVWQSVQS